MAIRLAEARPIAISVPLKPGFQLRAEDRNQAAEGERFQ
jgi:hypothetical protein